jgi:hypothetical protein
MSHANYCDSRMFCGAASRSLDDSKRLIAMPDRRAGVTQRVNSRHVHTGQREQAFAHRSPFAYLEP